jgi:NADPH-dependent 2,4-dienoyl-CoA reductase/sulfur reductase-like enzyme/ferredoxin
MLRKYSQGIRTLFVLSSILVALLALIELATATLARTASWAVGPMVEAYFDPGGDGPITAWMILAGILAVMMISFLVVSRFKRTGSRDRLDESSVVQQPTGSDPALPIFPNYIQLRSKARLSLRFWSWLRFGMVLATLIVVGALFIDADDGLWLWWQIGVPLLPLLFLVAPGVWRNVCPLATSNQLPRVLNFSRALTPPKWLVEYGFVIGMVVFFAMASSRKWLFNHNGPATGLLILAALLSAMLGGYLFKGKSGWCSSICPLYPVQRFYNRTPFATVPNAHCTPCVGCTKNCYDFNPGTAYLDDLHDDDPHHASYRKFFAAAMPGFIVAYFTLPDPIGPTAVLVMYLQFALYMVLSIGVFTVFDTFFKGSAGKLTAVFGAVALSLFYGFGLPNWLRAAYGMFSVMPPVWLAWMLESGIVLLTVVWVARTFRRERLYRVQRTQDEALRVVSNTPTAQSNRSEVVFMPGELRVSADASRTLLELAESHQQPIKSGCRMGVCGADPVLIVDGMDNLAPMGSDERNTLERLGLGSNCRLACMCRPKGPVTVSLDTNANIAPVTTSAPLPTTDVTTGTGPVVPPAKRSKEPAITFLPNELSVPVAAGCTLLEIAENNDQPIEAGCRMGICGADPVLIMDGMENLPPIGNEEKSTLERLGLGPDCRLACMCRVKGPVTVSLDTKAAAPIPAPVVVTNYDRSLKSIVIIGNGAAGITAADIVRRQHPECEIHLVSREKHHFYNRMAITRLIYGRSAMSGLYMQSEAWYDERKITCWLNTHATNINRGRKQVTLATGETLDYDRLILATGSSSFAPSIPGYGLSGSFVLREAEDAMEIRAYVQKQQCRTAVIAGGGLLGLETAYALHKMGLTVWVLERGEWLLRRQLDERGGSSLKQYLEALGLIVELNAEAEVVQGEDHVSQVTLKDGRDLACDLFLIAAGIQPNVDLAQAAGLKVNRGIMVDETMRTSALDIFSAGDACEFAGQIPGLWAVAVEQAKVAAINAVGGQATYNEIVPVTMLKVAGIDLISMGRIDARSVAEIEIAQQDQEGHGYRKLVVADGKLVGAILLGDPQNMTTVTAAVKEGRDVSQHLDALYAGQWEILGDTAVPSSTNDPSKWKPVPAVEPHSVPNPIPAPKAASKVRPRTIRPATVDWRGLPTSRSAMPQFAPAPQVEAAQCRPKVLHRALLNAHEHADGPVTPHERQPSVAFARPHQTRFHTIIFDFKRERSEIDASR